MRYVLLVVCSAALLSAQKTAGTLPRDAEGHPDLSGIWQAIGVSLFGETGELRPGEGTKSTWGPPVGPPPYQPSALAKVKELASDDRNDPTVHCMMAGVPRIFGIPVPFEIAQTHNKTYILYESNHIFRIIPADGRPHPDEVDPTFMGDSVGHWDGDTFVVDVTGFNDKTWLPGPGHFHSNLLHVTERYTLQPDNTIFYEATMEDPKVFTKSWQYRLILRHPPRDERIMEAECQENNQDLEHIVPDKR